MSIVPQHTPQQENLTAFVPLQNPLPTDTIQYTETAAYDAYERTLEFCTGPFSTDFALTKILCYIFIVYKPAIGSLSCYYEKSSICMLKKFTTHKLMVFLSESFSYNFTNVRRQNLNKHQRF